MRKLLAMSVASLLCVSLVITLGLASESTLKIFGNANMDNFIDEADIEYVQGIIEGRNAVTELADANYDGEIDEEDIIQIEQIIAREEDELTLIDMAGRTVTIPQPVERVVSTFPEETRVLVEVGGADKLVGVSSYLSDEIYAPNFLMLIAYPQLKELPGTGSYRDPNFEQIVSLYPDVVISGNSGPENADTIQEKTGVPTVAISAKFEYTGEGGAFEAYRLAGAVVGNEDEAEELITFIEDELDKVKQITSEISEDERIKVYYLCFDLTQPYSAYEPIELAGGINVARIGPEASVTVSEEQIIKWNPDVILIHSTSKSHSMGTVEDILSDPELQSINAIKDGRVYYSKGGYVGGNPASAVVEVLYMSKLFYPEEFEDMDVEAEGNRILERFYGVDGLYTYMQDNCDLYKWS
jgi:iron complex transport system substrate-binding protein